MPDPMETVARCAPSAEAAERVYRLAARMAYFDGTGGAATMPGALLPEASWDDCRASGLHLTDADDDGYCNRCGEREA